MYIIRWIQDVPCHPWKPELRQAWYTSINPFDILYNWISTRSRPCGLQVLCCLKNSWMSSKRPDTYKQPSTSLSMIESNYTRMYTSRFADYYVTKANLPVVSLHWYPACNSNQETKTNVRKSHLHSCNDQSCIIGSRCPYPCNHDVLIGNAAEVVPIFYQHAVEEELRALRPASPTLQVFSPSRSRPIRMCSPRVSTSSEKPTTRLLKSQVWLCVSWYYQALKWGLLIFQA